MGGREREKEEERDREGREAKKWGERQKQSCLFEKKTNKRASSGWKLKISLPQDGGGSGHGLYE